MNALQIFDHNAEPFGFMIQCPKCLWWTNSPRWHAGTCQFSERGLAMAKMPKGFKERDGKVKIAIAIEQKLFDAVVRNAEKHNWSFSESVSDVLKCGLLDLQDAGELELPEEVKQ